MRKSNKKGFTIVELVIVIAIIAILAAVLIPTFAGLIKKANTSADIQGCRQMNTYLAVNEVTADKTIVEVYNALKEGGMTAKDYHPLSNNTFYFWDAKLNRVLYTNDNYEVIYPEEYKNVKSTDAGHQWFSLTTEIKGDSSYTGKGTSNITVSSGEQFYQAVKDFEKSGEIKLKTDGSENVNFSNSITKDTTITLNGDIDMKGASLSIGAVANGKTLTIDGQGHKITGFCNLTEGVTEAKLNAEGIARNYYAGLIKYVDGATVVIKNITFDNVVVGNEKIGSAGILVGKAKNSTITFEDVSITNSTLYGKNKLGAFIGGQYAGGSDVSIKGATKLENVNIISTEGESGILFGSTSDSGPSDKLKIDKTLMENLDGFIKNCSVVCNSAEMYDAEYFGVGVNQTLDKKVVKKADASGYRLTTAYLGFAGRGTATQFKMNGTGDPKAATCFNPINTYAEAVAEGWVYDFTNNSKVAPESESN